MIHVEKFDCWRISFSFMNFIGLPTYIKWMDPTDTNALVYQLQSPSVRKTIFAIVYQVSGYFNVFLMRIKFIVVVFIASAAAAHAAWITSIPFSCF